MKSYLLYIVFSILYLSIKADGETTIVPTETTVAVVVQDTTTIEVMENSTVPQITEAIVQDTTQSVSIVVSNSTIIQKLTSNVYVEPPMHPRGYCIRSDLRCSTIRRCCKGPCDLIKMKCT